MPWYPHYLFQILCMVCSRRAGKNDIYFFSIMDSDGKAMESTVIFHTELF